MDREYLQEFNRDATEEMKAEGVVFHDIDKMQLKQAYQEVVAKNGYTFDPVWQKAVDAVIAAHPNQEE